MRPVPCHAAATVTAGLGASVPSAVRKDVLSVVPLLNCPVAAKVATGPVTVWHVAGVQFVALATTMHGDEYAG